MKKPNRKKKIPAKPLANGQIWRMGASDLHITDVGRYLVQYKLFRKETKRTVTTMSAMRVVENYLTENKAVLVQG